MACASLSPVVHGVNRSNASVVLQCYDFVSENDHVRMREGQKCGRNKNLAAGGGGGGGGVGGGGGGGLNQPPPLDVLRDNFAEINFRTPSFRDFFH